MNRVRRWTCTGVAGVAAVVVVGASIAIARADDGNQAPFLEGRLIAAGIPGPSAISQVGAFLDRKSVV